MASALLPAMDQVESALQKLQIPDFDKDRFLADFEGFLERVKTRGVYTH